MHTRVAARAALLLALLATAAAAAPAPAPAPADPALAALWASVIDAETNRGLKPERLTTYGRTHYYQLAQDPIGTLVRGSGGRAAGRHQRIAATAAVFLA